MTRQHTCTQGEFGAMANTKSVNSGYWAACDIALRAFRPYIFFLCVQIKKQATFAPGKSRLICWFSVRKDSLSACSCFHSQSVSGLHVLEIVNKSDRDCNAHHAWKGYTLIQRSLSCRRKGGGWEAMTPCEHPNTKWQKYSWPTDLQEIVWNSL